ncbi:MAG: peptidylprolyl isomerase [Proteobacteria bacterium]|nr:MAG: peptidylprolyl isomerase [Pseudomonadota bacterium]
MIEWMQHHRKYLVVTIWISTIAFVGAGFVGWGAYSFGNDKASSIAKVGNRNVTLRQFQRAYSNTYSYYNNLLGGKLTKEKAEQMGLQQNVIEGLINETLLLNYADELGLSVLDKDIKGKLANDTTFQKNGAFNIDQYKMVMKNIGLSANEYEEELRQEALLDKLKNVFPLEANKELTELLSASLFMEDKLSVKILRVDPSEIDSNKEKIKKFWEPIKDNFKTQKSYEIATGFVSFKDEKVSEDEIKEFYDEKKFNFLDKDGKIKSLENAKNDVIRDLKFNKARKTALRKYLDVKNKKTKLSSKMTIKDNELNYPVQKLATSNPNDVLKPFKQDDGYVVVQLIKTNLPQPMNFEQAFDRVETLYKAEESKKILTNKAKQALAEESFDGVETDFISRDTNSSLDGLSMNETRYFVSKLFDSIEKKSFVLVGEKAVVYDIVEQRLSNKQMLKKHEKQMSQTASKIENNEMQSKLLQNLRKRYKIEQYYKGN